MRNFDDLYLLLSEYLDELSERFLEPFLPADPTVEPADYEKDVRAFCILSHAAIEEFFEEVAKYVMEETLNDWISSRKYSETLVAMCAFTSLKIDIDENEGNSEIKMFDYFRSHFEKVKKEWSRNIADNHGISPRYLRKILLPIGVEIKEDIKLRNAFIQLAKQRGNYAHKGKVKSVLAPEDAKNLVYDCLELCNDVKIKANSKFS